MSGSNFRWSAFDVFHCCFRPIAVCPRTVELLKKNFCCNKCRWCFLDFALFRTDDCCLLLRDLGYFYKPRFQSSTLHRHKYKYACAYAFAFYVYTYKCACTFVLIHYLLKSLFIFNNSIYIERVLYIRYIGDVVKLLK